MAYLIPVILVIVIPPTDMTSKLEKEDCMIEMHIIFLKGIYDIYDTPTLPTRATMNFDSGKPMVV